MVKLLMENATTMSIDLNAKSNIGCTGFHYACIYGQTSTVELLLNNADALHLDFNSKNNDGDTGGGPCGHFLSDSTTIRRSTRSKCSNASMHDDEAQWGHFWLVHTSTVELLLNNADALHLDLTSKGYDGKTAFQQAQFKNETAVVELIKAKRPSIAV